MAEKFKDMKQFKETKRKDFEDGHYLLMERIIREKTNGLRSHTPWHITFNSQCGY